MPSLDIELDAIARYLQGLTDEERIRFSRLGIFVMPNKFTTTYLSRFDFKASALIDVGVANGTPELYKLFSGKTIYLIDPLPDLKQRVSSFNFDAQTKTKIYNVACGQHAGAATLHLQGDDIGKSTLGKPYAIQGRNTIKSIEVKVSTLDDIVIPSDGPFGLKVDTEGAELSVLKGATTTLAMCEFVIAEVSIKRRYEDGYYFSELCSLMGKHGFEPIEILNPIWRVHIFWDLLFVRRNSPLFSSRAV